MVVSSDKMAGFWKNNYSWYVLSTSFFIYYNKNESDIYLYNKYHLFALSLYYVFHQRVFRYRGALFWIANFYSWFRLLFQNHPFLTMRFNTIFFIMDGPMDGHDSEQHPPYVKPWEIIGLYLFNFDKQILIIRWWL